MRSLNIDYSHEFISNKIKDELLLNDIFSFNLNESLILKDIDDLFNFQVGLNRDINTLSGGQRSLTYLITLAYILEEKNIKNIDLELNNILESLTSKNRDKIVKYLKERGINVTKQG
ncbi:MAG: hypothetical protein OCD02_12175 [Spirochaetaceae bacterium]